ncbi:MAG: hypothetical protein ACOZE5_03005 [Verrucomicrobiota bacterium]
MKATKLLIAAAAFASLASLSFAGPGPEYWARMAEAAKNRASLTAKTKLATPAKAAPAPAVSSACTACSGCQARKS